MKKVYTIATDVVKKLRDHGYQAYFAGGFVRDLLLKNPSSDIDIATDASPKEVASIFKKHLLVGAQFGVCIVRESNHQFEIATFREDIGYDDGRRPSSVCHHTSPAEDAKRRDFTINGMFYDPIDEKVLDFVDGVKDLKKKKIRTIGNPEERFKEDRLRMIRAIRFAKRLGFKIEKKTESAIKKLAHTLLPSVSMERIWQEFVKMHQTQTLYASICHMAKLGLLQVIFPPLKSLKEKTIKSRIKGTKALSEHVAPILYLTKLFSEKEISFILGLAMYLRASKKETKQIEHYLELKTLFANDPKCKNLYEWTYLFASHHMKGSLELLISDLSKLKQIRTKRKLSRLEKKLAPHIERVQSKKPLCTAEDLAQFGIKPGRRMGKILDYAERLAISEDIHTKQKLLSRLKNDPILSLDNE